MSVPASSSNPQIIMAPMMTGLTQERAPESNFAIIRARPSVLRLILVAPIICASTQYGYWRLCALRSRTVFVCAIDGTGRGKERKLCRLLLRPAERLARLIDAIRRNFRRRPVLGLAVEGQFHHHAARIMDEDLPQRRPRHDRGAPVVTEFWTRSRHSSQPLMVRLTWSSAEVP